MVNAIPLESELVLVLDNGVSASGNPLTQKRSYSDIKSDASNDNVFAVAEVLSGLQTKTKIAVQRRDTIELQQA